ncbi:hypothetical protein Nepgr_008053 [Nepenthes gracilis]|uniref:Uncharacterized protein n=1 Tax=Nepenthes gracilis TaxID=150966 RepID=A0AAD3S7Z7_NEPGR|nr:hypothetical protein Nepgr_008053 [Nepenthes gracilis]
MEQKDPMVSLDCREATRDKEMKPGQSISQTVQQIPIGEPITPDHPKNQLALNVKRDAPSDQHRSVPMCLSYVRNLQLTPDHCRNLVHVLDVAKECCLSVLFCTLIEVMLLGCFVEDALWSMPEFWGMLCGGTMQLWRNKCGALLESARVLRCLFKALLKIDAEAGKSADHGYY